MKFSEYVKSLGLSPRLFIGKTDVVCKECAKNSMTMIRCAEGRFLVCANWDNPEDITGCGYKSQIVAAWAE